MFHFETNPAGSCQVQTSGDKRSGIWHPPSDLSYIIVSLLFWWNGPALIAAVWDWWLALQVSFTTEECLTNGFDCKSLIQMQTACLVIVLSTTSMSAIKSTWVNSRQPVCLVLVLSDPLWSMFQGRSRSSIMGQCGIDRNSDQLLALQWPNAGPAGLVSSLEFSLQAKQVRISCQAQGRTMKNTCLRQGTLRSY